MKRRTRRSLGVAVALVALTATVRMPPPAFAAENLRLAPALSFTDDSSSRFPIEGDDLAAGDTRLGRATVVFFGASHCWNTNREAERVVAVYPRFRHQVRFIVVDVNHPSEAQRPLMRSYFHGFIPTLAIIDAAGAVVYAEAGETARERGDTDRLTTLIRRALGE